MKGPGFKRTGFLIRLKSKKVESAKKNIMNRCQAKALREGCCERKEAWTGVSSREKMNTNKNLVRATTKSKK